MEIRKKHGDSESFLKTFNPSNQTTFINLSLERCFIGNAPSLTRVKFAYDEETAIHWLEVQLVDLALTCGIPEKPTIEQATEISRSIIANFGFLKVTELMVFFSRFKGGRYGKFYGCIDLIVVTDALNTFLSERIEIINKFERAQQKREAEEKKRKADENAISKNEWEEIKHYFNFEIYD